MFVCILYKYVQVYAKQLSSSSTEDFILGHLLVPPELIGNALKMNIATLVKTKKT